MAQEAFIKAHKHFPSLKDKDASRAWLFQIAYRSYADYARKEARRNHLKEVAAPHEDTISHTATGLQLDIERAMDALPPDCRAVVILCLAYGFSHSEAARAMNMPLGTIKSHTARGKTKLRAFLSAYERAD